MQKNCFRIEVDGHPVRLFVSAQTKLRTFATDRFGASEFNSIESALKKAALYKLTDFKIKAYPEIILPTPRKQKYFDHESIIQCHDIRSLFATVV